MGRRDVDQCREHVVMTRTIELKEFVRAILVGVFLCSSRLSDCLFIDLALKRTNFPVPLSLDFSDLEILFIVRNIGDNFDWINIAILGLLVDKDFLVGREPVRAKYTTLRPLVVEIGDAISTVEHENQRQEHLQQDLPHAVLTLPQAFAKDNFAEGLGLRFLFLTAWLLVIEASI